MAVSLTLPPPPAATTERTRSLRIKARPPSPGADPNGRGRAHGTLHQVLAQPRPSVRGIVLLEEATGAIRYARHHRRARRPGEKYSFPPGLLALLLSSPAPRVTRVRLEAPVRRD